MLPTPGELVRSIARPARKALGQNFLTDPNILDRILDAAGVEEGTAVVEIGPGPGGLTTRALARGADVRAIEIDDELADHLERAFPDDLSLEVRRGDVLDVNLDELLGDPPRIVLGNLPYNVATAIVARLLERPTLPPRMALMFQREVAERLACAGAAREFGPLGVLASLRTEATIAMRLPPGAFVPRPKVASALVVLEPLAEPRATGALAENTKRLARAAFGRRRKMLRNTLRDLAEEVGLSASAWLESAGLAETARPEELTVDELIELARALPSE